MQALFSLLLPFWTFTLASEPPPSIEGFAQLLNELYEKQSKFHLVEETFSEIKANVRVRSEYPRQSLESGKAKLQNLFAARVNALKKLTESAETSVQFYTEYRDDQLAVPQDEAVCAKYMTLLNDSDVHYPSSKTSSGVHLNLESYQCDPRVIRDFEWTRADVIEKTMEQNKADNPDMSYQYIGTYSGLTRMYPRRKWEVEPSPITIDLFDPKFRPWFVAAETVPKDIVFLIDYSGSVKGPTMHLAKLTIMYILSTLSPDDYFLGIYFNSNFEQIMKCSNLTFLPGTTSNKKIFFERLGEIEEKDQAHLVAPLNFSLKALRKTLKSESSFFSDARSGGHKLVMLFTDGVDEWPQAVMDEEIEGRGGDLIRIFGFSMGYLTGQLQLLEYLSCATHAKYSVIDSIMDVKPQSRAYLDYLSTYQGRVLENIPVHDRPVTWTNLYMEAQGLGPTITVSMPVVAQPGPVWLEQRLAGVVGVDISLQEMLKVLPHGEHMYGFIVDNNGLMIYHPKLILPKTEVHCVRRSACYDASQVRSRAGQGLRVQYGFSDQRVYRLVGLIDSIPTIDLFEIEGNSTIIHALRQAILSRNCTDEAFTDGQRQYLCTSLDSSPFSLVIASSLERDTVIYGKVEKEMDVSVHPMATYFYSKRDVCDFELDRIDSQMRFSAIQSLDECSDDLSLTRAMTTALKPWVESWPRSERTFNGSCANAKPPDDIEAQYFSLAFVHTRAQVTAFYPTCETESMKHIVRKFDDEKATKGDTSYLQFSRRNDAIIAYRTINDKYGNRLAVVGIHWRKFYLTEVFRNFTRANQQWDRCRKMDCILVTRSGFVVASSSGRSPDHLASYDPQLFSSLVKEKLVALNRWVEAQAECPAKRIAPWSSPAPRPKTFFRSLFDIVATLMGKSFWIDLYYYLTTSLVSGQPTMTKGGICHFKKIEAVERCFLQHTHIRLTLNITRQLQLEDIKCSRYARVYPVPLTSLTVIETDHLCPGYKRKQPIKVAPVRLSGCDVVHSFSRRQPDFLSNITEPYRECAVASTSTFTYFSATTFALSLLSLFY